MALKAEQAGRLQTVGQVPHDSLVRVDKRVKEILARREATLQKARRDALHPSRSDGQAQPR